MITKRALYRLFRNGIIVLLIFIVLMEAVLWSLHFDDRLTFITQSGGFVSYLGSLVRNTLLPEMMTVFSLAIMIYTTRHWFKIRLIDLTGKALSIYQLSFLPTLLIAFVVCIPFTQSVRYLLTEFAAYSFDTYWNTYIIGSYSWTMYFRYLFFILLIGYSMLNISLATDFSTSRVLPLN